MCALIMSAWHSAVIIIRIHLRILTQPVFNVGACRESMIPNSFQEIRCGGTIRELPEPQGLTAADSRGPAFLPLLYACPKDLKFWWHDIQIECVDVTRFFQFTSQMFAFFPSKLAFAWYSTRSGSKQIVDARRNIGVRLVQGHAFIKETGRERVYVRITDNIQF